MIKSYYTALGDFFKNNIFHPTTRKAINVIVAGADVDLAKIAYPSIVMYKMVSMDIATGNPRFIPPTPYTKTVVKDDGSFDSIQITKPETLVNVMSSVEVWSLDTLEDINLTSAILRLFGGRFFQLDVVVNADRIVTVNNEVTAMRDLSTKGRVLGAYPQDKLNFRRQWSIATTILLLQSDQAPEVGTPVTTYEHDLEPLP